MSVAVFARPRGYPPCHWLPIVPRLDLLGTVTYFQCSAVGWRMWPLGHAAGAYLLASVGAERDWLPDLDAATVVAVLLASQLPDLIDKPLAWYFPVLPAGRSMGHSLFVVVPLCLVAILLARRVGRRGIGVAVSLALLSHLALDAIPALWGGAGWRYLLWPLLSVSGFDSPPSVVAMFEDSLDRPYFWAEFVLAGLALVRWRTDGWPGVSWLFEAGAGGPTLLRSRDRGD